MTTDRRIRDPHGDATRVERADPLLGTVIDGRFRIDFQLAAGGFGAIYRATELETRRPLAVKVLHATASSDDRLVARFRREAETLVQLRDPHTVTAYATGEDDDGLLYIAMELLRGESLYEVFRAHGPLTWTRVVGIARMVCSSLGEAHELGIVHRDLKPANIHLEKRDGTPDFVKVLDFGIAKIMRHSGLDSSDLTQAGQVIGTLDYMAPEQMVGGECTPRTDIYTLGVVMFEMIAGRRPFGEVTNATGMLAALLTQVPPPLSELVAVPRELERIVARCLEREPQQRYASVAELDAALAPLTMLDDATRKMSTAPVHDDVTVLARPRRPATSPPQAIAREAGAPVVRRPPTQPPPPEVDEDGTVMHASPPAPAPIMPTPTPQPLPVAPVVPARNAPAAAAAPPPGWQPAPGAPATTPPPGWQGWYPPPAAPQPPPPGWSPPAPQGYDLATEHVRELLVRRIVWGVAAVFGVVLAIVTASQC